MKKINKNYQDSLKEYIFFLKKNYDHLYGRKKKFVKIDFNSWDYSNALSIKLNKKKIMEHLTINKSKYKYYKYKYLTPKNKTIEKIPNYKIIGDFIEKHF